MKPSKAKRFPYIAAAILIGCFESGPIETGPTDEDFALDLPIVRALLDSNGLNHISETKVAQIKSDHTRWYVLALSNLNLKTFRFTTQTKNIRSLKTLDLSGNNLSMIPKGIELGPWTVINMHYNQLCSLTPADSAFLLKIGADYGDQTCSAK